MNDKDRDAIVRVKQQLSHLFKPNPVVYWLDLVLSSAIGWSAFCFAVYVDSSVFSAICALISVFALYRALAFTHELEHQPNGVVPGFRAVWHVLAGMPFGLPHFLYRNVHRIHHSPRYYGTPEDPEYIPFVVSGSFRTPMVFLLLPFTFPVLVAVRYLVLVPLALLIKPLRKWLDSKASAFVMKLDYARNPPAPEEVLPWRLEEFSTTLFFWLMCALVASGRLSTVVVQHWYLLLVGVMLANALRGLAATHRYEATGAQLAFDDHIYDSVNLEKFSLFTALVCPLGLSLHATHHIFPTLPYYALRRAHRLLIAESRSEQHPLACYVSGQWSDFTVSVTRLTQLIRSHSPKQRRPAHSRRSESILPG